MDFIVRPNDTFIEQLSYSDYTRHRYLAENSDTTSYPSSAPTVTSNTPSSPNTSVSECLKYYIEHNYPKKFSRLS